MIGIELVFVTPTAESLFTLQLESNATVGDAIAAVESDLQSAHPEYRCKELATGIWGEPAASEQRLKDGDRVEIYRELERDPMEARRLRALG